MKRLRRALQRRIHPPQTLPSGDAYALWATSYPPTAHNRLMQIEQDAMLALMPPLAGRDVLDLAGGTGRYALIAQESGARQIVGVDSSAAMLRANPLSPRVQAEMNAIPFCSGSFDVVICALAAGHLPPEQMRLTLTEIKRVLRPGGVALISDFHPFMFLSGGRRTFTAPDGVQYAVEHYPHLIADYYAAIRSAGLTLDALAEPCAERLDETAAPAVLVLRVTLA